MTEIEKVDVPHMLYALHPGSLPPKGVREKTRIDISAEDLVRLYRLKAWEFIIWDPADGYDWFDFIHLYPSYYERYTRLPDGTSENDVPCGSSFEKSRRAGTSSGSRAGITRKR